MNVYVHVELEGIVHGIGGYVGFTALYEELTKLGYTVYFFDPRSQIKSPTRLIDVRPQAAWLSHEGLLIVGLPFVRKDSGKKIIVSAWMNQHLYETIVSNHWESSFVWWACGQLLRQGYGRETQWVRSLLDKGCMPLLLDNRYLESVYKKHLNLEHLLYFDGFNRTELFYCDMGVKRPGRVGYQPEARADTPHLQEGTARVTRLLESHVGGNLLFCTGSHKEVADAMKQCDVFFWHNTSNVNIKLFVGEELGRSMLEALACGCVVIAKRNYFTQQIFPRELLCSSPEEGTQILRRLLANPSAKESLRARCLAIGQDYRFDGFNKDRIKTFNYLLQKMGQPTIPL